MDIIESWMVRAFTVALLFGITLVGPVAAQFGLSPDLVVEGLAIEPAEPEPGSTVELVATILNRGEGRVLLPFSVVIELDGEILKQSMILSRLEPGQKLEVSALWTAAEGEHRVRVRVDAFDDIDESDESNNVLVRTFEVRRLEGIRSITLALFEALSRALQEAGQALELELETTDLFQLVGLFDAASRSAAQAFAKSAKELAALREGLPPNLAQEEQIRMSGQAAGIYRSLAAAFEGVREALQRLNLQLLLSSFAEIREGLLELSSLSLEGITGLANTIPLMDRLLEKAEQLQEALGGAGEDIDAVAQELVSLLSQIGMEWVRTGEELIRVARQRAARFTDAQDQPITSYHAGEELRISVAGAQSLKWEVFDPAGNLRFSGESQGEAFTWEGIDNDGNHLPAGRYFYRLTITESDMRVELGRIMLNG